MLYIIEPLLLPSIEVKFLFVDKKLFLSYCWFKLVVSLHPESVRTYVPWRENYTLYMDPDLCRVFIDFINTNVSASQI